MPNVIRIRIEGTGDRDVIAGMQRIITETSRADRSLTEAGRAADRMGQMGERAGRDVEQSMHRAAEAAEDVGDSAEDSGGALGALGERASGAMDGLTEHTGMAGEMLGKLGPYGKAAAVAIGAGMVAAGLAVKTFMSLIEKANTRTADLAQSKAYMGLAGADAAKFGKLAAEVYVDNWGETIKDAGETVRNAALYIWPTAQKMDGVVTPSLKVISERVQALADTMGEDTKRVSFAIGQMLKTGMAKNVDEAFNLMHAALANGSDGMDNLIDQMTEYGTLIEQSGISAKQLFGILKQSADAGVFDDKAIDAFKEFRLRVTGGGQAIDDAFKSMGLNAKQMTEDITAGGPKGAEALAKVLDGLRTLGPESQTAALAIQSLFGGPGEDLGAAIFKLNLHTAEAALGDISGAAKQAGETLSATPMASLEAYKRKWEMFQADMGDKLVPTFMKFLDKAEEFAHEVAPVVAKMLENISKKWAENSDEIKQFGELMEIIVGVVAKGAIGALYLAIMALIDGMTNVGKAWGGVKEAFVVGGMIILDVLGWIIHAAASAFGWIPGIGPKLKNAAAEFDDFKVRANEALMGIIDKDIRVRVQVSQSGYAPVTAVNAVAASTHRFSAAGGPGGALPTIVNEGGPELIDWQAGRVSNFQQTRRALSGMGAGGGGGATTIVMQPILDTSSSEGLDSIMVRWWNDALNSGRMRLAVGGDGSVQPA